VESARVLEKTRGGNRIVRRETNRHPARTEKDADFLLDVLIEHLAASENDRRHRRR
jgi:hypothetical protein